MQALCCLKLLAIIAELLCDSAQPLCFPRGVSKAWSCFFSSFCLFVCKGPSELCSFPWEIKRLANVTLIPRWHFKSMCWWLNVQLHGYFSNELPYLKMTSKMSVCLSSSIMVKFPGEVYVTCWLQWEQHRSEGKICLMDWLIVRCLVLCARCSKELSSQQLLQWDLWLNFHGLSVNLTYNV